MKKLLGFIPVFLAAVCLLCACANKGNVIGVWSCELYGSEQIIEFTSDGKFIDRTVTGFFGNADGTENCYRVKNGKLEIYVEEDPTSTVTLEYSVKDDTLTLGGVEYQRVEIPKNDEAETAAE